MGDLTKNFNRSEFACKCGCGFDKIDASVVFMAQVIRDAMNETIRINSACRCVKHNANVGGVKDSFHTQGKAADLSCASGSEKLYNAIQKLYAEGKLPQLQYCKRYKGKNFCHIDCGKARSQRFTVGE